MFDINTFPLSIQHPNPHNPGHQRQATQPVTSTTKHSKAQAKSAPLFCHLFSAPRSIYSSSSRFIALDRALSASASPPARLGPPCGVDAPLRSGVPLPLFAYPESLGVVAPGEGFAPRTGLFAGGAGGVGFALAAPLVLAAAGAGGGGGREDAAGGGGGGGGAVLTSSR